MHIKRFEADSLELALSRVKAEFGPDALILSSRSVQRGRRAFGLLSRETVEVHAALSRPQGNPAPLTGEARVLGDERADPGAGTIESTLGELRSELARLRANANSENEIRDELRALRQTVNGLSTRGEPGSDEGAAVERLVNSGMSRQRARSLAERWAAVQREDPSRSLEAWVLGEIEARLTPPRTDQGRALRVFVGAPGVGKTTTLTKLAARAEEGERDIALAALNQNRAGATACLEFYARQIEAPFRSLVEPEQLRSYLAEHRGHSMLVDTPGQSQGDPRTFEALQALRKSLGERMTIEWVVDATSRADVLHRQWSRFSPLQPDRVIATKVDESASLSSLAELLLEPDMPPLCWLAHGQRVPDDIVVAESGHFRGALADGSACV